MRFDLMDIICIGIILFFLIQAFIYIVLILKIVGIGFKDYKSSIFSEAKDIINNPDKFLDEKQKS